MSSQSYFRGAQIATELVEWEDLITALATEEKNIYNYNYTAGTGILSVQMKSLVKDVLAKNPKTQFVLMCKDPTSPDVLELWKEYTDVVSIYTNFKYATRINSSIDKLQNLIEIYGIDYKSLAGPVENVLNEYMFKELVITETKKKYDLNAPLPVDKPDLLIDGIPNEVIENRKKRFEEAGGRIVFIADQLLYKHVCEAADESISLTLPSVYKELSNTLHCSNIVQLYQVGRRENGVLVKPTIERFLL